MGPAFESPMAHHISAVKYFLRKPAFMVVYAGFFYFLFAAKQLLFCGIFVFFLLIPQIFNKKDLFVYNFVVIKGIILHAKQRMYVDSSGEFSEPSPDATIRIRVCMWVKFFV